MKMIRAFIRPEKEQEVVQALEGAGFPSLTKMPVFGGSKRGFKSALYITTSFQRHSS
jgi:nitrogen regulatory protein PII 1